MFWRGLSVCGVFCGFVLFSKILGGKKRFTRCDGSEATLPEASIKPFSWPASSPCDVTGSMTGTWGQNFFASSFIFSRSWGGPEAR